ncbi:ATP-binding protein [uncultured Ruminococcus sp.]|uniref:ATP-binding protein n=1 Tax=uncultured Ruminococcus sp. TaxID=165186 RepID=UPI0025E2D721|nr:ATP-binding protein [uncultured Ruminococcus sp.]
MINTSGDTLIIDIRDELSFEYGHIDGAVNIPADRLYESQLPKDKKLFICCKSGLISDTEAEKLRELGYDAENLEGGYYGWLREKLSEEVIEDISQDAERSIQKKFRKSIWVPFIAAVKRYELIQENDKIAVCISGGKDSMLMAKLLQELQKYSEVPFELVYLVMDPGYNELNRKKIESNAALLHIPITIFETDIFSVANNTEKNPCYLCAKMRRGHLYSKAKSLGCNKIALGHHYDDVIETILMGMLWGAQVQTMMPKLHSTNFPGMELIRPMYLIREDDIKAWRDANDLHFIQCACRFTEERDSAADGVGESKRQEMKLLLRQLKKTNPNIEKSMFRAIHGVQLDTFPGFKFRGRAFAFPEAYNLRGASSAEDEAAL